MALNKVVGLAGRFRRDRGGNFMVMAGVVMGVLALAVGFAVDVGQMMNARSALSNAIDAAVTSTARDLTTGTATEDEAKKIIKVYLDANSAGGILGGNQIVLENVTLDRTAHTLEVSAHVDVPLYFPLFGSEKTRRVTQIGKGVFSFRQIEVAMILDVTGSMQGAKIKALKKAAKIAVETIFEDTNPTRPRVRVALVPYANSVNVGDTLAASSVFVENSESDRKQAPGNKEPRPASTSVNAGNCATERKGIYQYTDAGPEISMVNRDLYLGRFAGDDACPKAAMMPLTSDSAALLARIKTFAALGGTAGHIGVQWGWYLLSPNWAATLAESQRPMEYDTGRVGKYAILMTDGQFNLSYFDAKSAGQVSNPRGKKITRDAATELCAAMRDKGIEIYTIGFDLDPDDTDASDTLKKCANADSGGVKHFYQTSTEAELIAAFKKIADNFNKLALTK